jgi:hypothetical protein
MTRPSGAHLSPDEIDACLAGAVSPKLGQHLAQCQSCLELVRADREIADLISSLPLMGPSAGFADRVMASVAIPDPFALRSLQATRRRLISTRRSFAYAAGLVLFLLSSMAGSVAWSLTHQATLANMGTWILSHGGQALWLVVQGLTSTIMEQPWYQGVRVLAEHPARLGLISGMASLTYLVGLVALRRLLAVPARQVAHAGA